jgi:hypothetical protein
MAILVPKWAGFQLAGPAADVSKILYGESRKSYGSPSVQYNISRSAKFLTVKCSEYIHHLGVMELFGALHSFSSLRSTRNYNVRLGPHTICDFHHTTF